MALGLGDLISSVKGVFTQDPLENSNIDNNMLSGNAAAEAYGLTGFLKEGGNEVFNIPKLPYQFLIQVVLTETATLFLSKKYPGFNSQKWSYVVKDCDIPSQTFVTYTTNQYNRKRIYTGKVQYVPINMVLYDTVDSSGLRLYDAYRSWYNADFHNKRLSDWDYNQVSTTENFEDDQDMFVITERGETYRDLSSKLWGRSVMNHGDLSESYFFKRIDILEHQDGIFTYHNIHNPIITSANFTSKSHESDGAPSTISFNIDYEGISHRNPLMDGMSDPIAISRNSEELGSLLTSTELNKDRHFNTNLPMDSTEEDSKSSLTGSIGAIADTVLDTVGGATEALGIDGLDGVLNNIGNAVNAGTTLVDDTASAVSSNAINSIGGLF